MVDRRFLYSGGANITDKSNINEEYCYRMTGPVVHQVPERLAAQRLKGKVFKGS